VNNNGRIVNLFNRAINGVQVFDVWMCVPGVDLTYTGSRQVVCYAVFMAGAHFDKGAVIESDIRETVVRIAITAARMITIANGSSDCRSG
jgi:hypothetical protein